MIEAHHQDWFWLARTVITSWWDLWWVRSSPWCLQRCCRRCHHSCPRFHPSWTWSWRWSQTRGLCQDCQDHHQVHHQKLLLCYLQVYLELRWVFFFCYLFLQAERNVKKNRKYFSISFLLPGKSGSKCWPNLARRGEHVFGICATWLPVSIVLIVVTWLKLEYEKYLNI